MRLTASIRRYPALLAALLAALTVTLAGPPVAAEPGGAGTRDDEGGTAELREQLEAAAKGYLDAETALHRSQRRQQELTAQLGTMAAELAAHSATIEDMAAVAYRTGRVGTLSALLGAQSPEGLFDRAIALNAVAANEQAEVRRLVELRQRVTLAKAAIDTEAGRQRQQLAVMAERKRQAERALAEAAAKEAAAARAAEEAPAGSSTRAAPAPRNPDGSWPAESCSEDDPTTSGCLTPRMLHALNQARAAGFTRYVSCYRSGGSGEHPKGRACDWAAQQDGFGGAATGGDRVYGNNLAAFFVSNASRLAVLYVIWYRQIWLPGTGWRAYSGSGSPSAEHTNHVHVSVY